MNVGHVAEGLYLLCLGGDDVCIYQIHNPEGYAS